MKTGRPQGGGLRNLRDIGGLPAAGRRVTRSGLVYRAEAPVNLSDEGLEAVKALRLHTALDLRDREEDVFVHTTLPEGVERLYAGVQPPADPGGKGLLQQVFDGERLDYSAAELGELYVEFLEGQAKAFGRAIAFCAEEQNLPTLIHCHAGKDRTGLVVAMLLDVVGVEREAVMSDYELTTYFRAYRRQEVADALAASGTDWDRVAPLFIAPPEALAKAIAHLETLHGSVRGFLAGPGEVDEAALDRLPDMLLDANEQ
jgi:protein-tyrosine phosphatase